MMIKNILFTSISAILILLFAGCSDRKQSPDVRIGKNNVVLHGKIRCPQCRKSLRKNELLPAKPPLARCALCGKPAPVFKFYPQAVRVFAGRK